MNQTNNQEAQSDEQSQIQQAKSIINVFKGEFSSTVNVVYINSLKRNVNFRDISVQDQKSLSKTMIENEKRKDIIYDTQCALINRLCLEEGFDIYQLTEFDRIRILMEIYQNNYFQNEIKFKCPECGTENSYVLDFDRVLDRLNKFDIKDQTYTMEDRDRIYNFTLNYPNVRNVSNFYRNYMKKYKGITTNQREALDNLGNIEYINLFIKEIELINKANPNDKKNADLTIMTYADIEELLSLFPQNIIFDDEKGVLKHITTEFIESINNVFNYEKCANCGRETNEGIGSLIDFF